MCRSIVVFELLILIYFTESSDSNHSCVCAKAKSSDIFHYDPTPPPTDDGQPTAADSRRTVFRLPDALVPFHYDVELQPFLWDESNSFKGWTTVWFSCVNATRDIVLHAANLVLHTVELRTDGSDQNHITDLLIGPLKEIVPRVKDFSLNAEQQTLKVRLTSQLSPGKHYSLHITYDGHLRECMEALCKIGYNNSANQTSYLSFSDFEPTNARQAFPCFDEPALKATFNVTLVRTQNMTSLSNMPMYRSIPRNGEWIADYFEKTVKMSTYLVAFAFLDDNFQYTETMAGKTKIRIWAEKEILHKTSYTVQTTPKVLTILENYLNLSYTLSKIDMVAVPMSDDGAMENWGLITFDSDIIICDASKEADMLKTTFFIAHELAHQWFGNLVTMKWWNDIWMNEGFATFMEYIVLSNLTTYSDAQISHLVMKNIEMLNADVDGGLTSIAVTADEVEMDSDLFKDNIYAKGALIIKILETILGKESFRRGVHEFLKTYQYNSAVQDDLWSTFQNVLNLTERSHLNLKAIMDSWTLQKGYPLVTVKRDYVNGVASIRQKPYCSTSSCKNSEKGFEMSKWNVPLTFTTSTELNFNDTKPRKWLLTSDDYIILKPNDGVPGAKAWMLFNIDLVGYYRVNYDATNWNLLLKQLKEDHSKIPVVNRLQILSDIRSLTRNLYISIGRALSAVEYLMKEDAIEPWVVGMPLIGDLVSYFRSTSLFTKLKILIKPAIRPLWGKLGIEDNLSDRDYIRKIRSGMIRFACEIDLEDCVKEGFKYYVMWRQNYNEIMEFDFNIMCAALRSSLTIWEDFWSTYIQPPVNTKAEELTFEILNLFSCSNDQWQLSRYLGLLLEPSLFKLQKKDFEAIIKRVGKNFYGKKLLVNFVQQNWNTLQKIPSMPEVIIKGLTAFPTTEEEWILVKSFLSCLPLENTYDCYEDLEKTEKKIKLQSTLEKDVRKWFEKSQHLFY